MTLNDPEWPQHHILHGVIFPLSVLNRYCVSTRLYVKPMLQFSANSFSLKENIQAQYRLHMVDGVVLPFLISRYLTVATANEIKTDGGMQSTVICINTVLLQ